MVSVVFLGFLFNSSFDTEKRFQTLKPVFDLISKHHKVHQKSSAACRVFNFFFGV